MLVCYIVNTLTVLNDAANRQQFIKPNFSQYVLFNATLGSLFSSRQSSLEILVLSVHIQ